MKRIVLLISVVHLALAFSSSCTSATTTPNQVSPEPVRDVSEELLRSDTKYFILPAIGGPGGGGVTGAPLPKSKDGDGDTNVCPSQVVQSPLRVDTGTSVYFKPMDTKEVEITESTPLNIEFYLDNPTEICNNTVWEVEGPPGHHSLMLLSTKGVAGKPTTWFKIKKYNVFSYKLVFCPFGNRGYSCSDVGMEIIKGQRRLGVSAIRGGSTGFVA